MSVVAAPKADVWPDLVQKLGLDKLVPPATTPTRNNSSAGPSSSVDLMRPCVDGERTQHLLALCGTLIGRRVPFDHVLSICRAWNAKNNPPLPDEKIVATCSSIAKSDRAKHADRYAMSAFDADLLEPLSPLFDLSSASVKDFLATEPPKRKWLLDGFLPQGIVGGVVAPGGSSKSQFLMQLAYSVASGLPLADRWEVAETGTVLMLCAEDDRDEIHRRVFRIHDAQCSGQPPGLAKKIERSLLVRSVVGEDMLLTRKRTTNGEVDRTQILRRLGLTAAQVEDLKLIILDPASRFRGGEENSNEDATRFVEALEWLRKETGATVLIAHHTNKASMSAREINQTASRGASALTDGIRWQLSISAVTKSMKEYSHLSDEDRRRHLEVKLVKTNYTAPQPPVLLHRLDHGYLQAPLPGVNQPSPYDQQLGVLLTLVRQTPVTARQLERDYCGSGKPLDVPQRVLRGLIASAAEMGFLDVVPRKPLVLTPEGAKLADELVDGTAPSGRGAARQRRTTRKKATKSKT